MAQRPDLGAILDRYRQLDALLTRAIERCEAKDAPEAGRLAAGAVAKTLTLDEMLKAAGIVEESDDLQRRRRNKPVRAGKL